MPTEAEEQSGAARDTVLFLFAHQDDEFGVFGHIADEKRRGIDVVCAYLTDGGWNGQDIAIRNAETIAVLRDLGVPSTAVLMIGERASVPDGKLHLHVESAWQALERSLAGRRVARVFMPAWEGGHQDHDVTHLVGLRVAARHGVLDQSRQFPLYHGAGLVGPLFRTFSPLPENGPVHRLPVSRSECLKYSTWLLRYRSQIKSIAGLLIPATFGLTWKGGYLTQPVDVARTSARPHPGALLYERRVLLSFEELMTTTARFRAALISDNAARYHEPAGA